jgi:hypothetical protein
MHHNPIPGLSPADAEQAFDTALLGLLVHDHDGLWSIAELARTLSSSAQAAATEDGPPTYETEDAIERLHAAGLIHRVGPFVFASRAAHMAQRLAG